jgi:hypothetical protein
MIIIFSRPEYLSAQNNQSTGDTIQHWKIKNIGSMTLSQTAFRNWASGGENSISSLINFAAFANYTKGKVKWENDLEFNYGQLKQGNREPRKTDDMLYLSTMYGVKMSGDWYYSVMANLKTQLFDGYKYFDEPEDSSTLIATTFSPAHYVVSLGLDYKPNDNLSVHLSPLTAKYIAIPNKEIRQKNLYGDNEFRNGGYVKINYQKELLKNLNIRSKIEVFSYYFTELSSASLNWELYVNYNLWNVFSVNLFTHAIYDTEYTGVDNPDLRWQFKEVLGFGLSYRLANYDEKKKE